MALTRKFLKAMGIDEEKIDQIIEAHSETVDALKEQRDKFETDSQKLSDVTAERDKLKADLDKIGKDSYKVKYDEVKAEFEQYKATETAQKAKAEKTEAFKNLLKELNVKGTLIDKIVSLNDIDKLEVEDGKIKKAEELSKSLKEEWKDFIVETNKTTEEPKNPPSNNPADPENMSMDEYIKYRSQK